MSTSRARKRTLSPAAMSRQYYRAEPGQWASTAVPRSSTLRSQIFALIRTRPVLLAPIKIPKLSKKASAIQDPASLASKQKERKNSLRVEQFNSEVSTLPADAKLHLRLIDTQYCGSKGGGRNSTDSRWPRKRHMSPTPRTTESTRQVAIGTPLHCHSPPVTSRGPTGYPGLQLFALLPLLAGDRFKTCRR
ncbi:hypothetical protein QR685DRAFT_575956 [Neurospora intermedia]|uniref:Uncharacterized protein n=1 Tax=Neurospora intermedia TaxID=5142 RepID=A0ABR3CYD1_NEUIN